MEEDVDSRDVDGVDGRGVHGWDDRVCGLGTVNTGPHVITGEYLNT
jgi:hypothetical protein